jgi:hypothetical protein
MKTQKKEFRCSDFGHLMVGATMPGTKPLTEAQQRNLDELMSKVKLTEKQAQTRDELIEKRDKIHLPELSKGAKTYVEKLFVQDRFDYKMRFSTLSTQKGNEVEQESIRQVGTFLGYPFATKAKEKFMSNGLIKTRGYDWRVSNFVFDQKNVWQPESLKFFDDEKEIGIYEWQIRGYAMLINEHENATIERGAVIRTLMNPPENLIWKQARLLWVEAGNSWDEPISDEFFQEIKNEFDFEGKRPNIIDRMRIHSVECTNEHFDLIKLYVGMAQNYYDELNEKIQHVNDSAIEIFKNKK